MRLLLVFNLVVGLTATRFEAQSLLYRPPNLGGTWSAEAGVVHFNFLHRFYVAPSAGGNKVTNFPTFTLAVGLGRSLMLGDHYGSNSFVVTSPYRPNETELFARWRILGAEGQPGVALAITPAYNFAARSVDGEAGVDYTAGRLTLSAAVRGMSKAFGRSGGAELALAGGAVVRLNRYIALGGDYAGFLDVDTTAAWSAGVMFLIPGSPHTFSLQASKSTSNTIQGSSFGFGEVLYGFEFTIPLHLKRFAPWFGKGGGAATATGAAVAAAVQVRMEGFRYQVDTVTIAAGQAVRWINADPLQHTVTFAEGGPASSGLIPADGSFVVQFDRPGTYAYHCLPHPFMKGVVVVR